MRTVGSIIVFLCFKISSFSQTVKIVDSVGQTIPYATIELSRSGIARFADQNGEIDMSLFKIGESDSLVVSSIGFKSQKLPRQKMAGKIVLERQVTMLEDAFVFSGEWKKENWGSLKKPGLLFGYGCSWSLNGPGSQIGRIINVIDENKKPAWIYRIAFYTNGAEETRTPVRLRLYAINEKGMPGRDLLVRTIIERTDKRKGWLEYDLSDNSVRIPEGGLIVAAEYFDTDSTNWHSRKVVYTDSSGKKREVVTTRYGANFSTNKENNQGQTVVRQHGHWIKVWHDGKNPECENLVVRVLVRYPERKVKD
jgi:hypothetical protein